MNISVAAFTVSEKSINMFIWIFLLYKILPSIYYHTRYREQRLS